MHLDAVLAALAKAGTAQNCKVYARHGVRGAMFGVSCAELGKLEKRLGTNHSLALELWRSANHDARVLATKIADPHAMDERTLNAWAAELDNYVLTDACSSLAARTPQARALMARWTAAPGEWIAAAGWNLVAFLALRDRELPEAAFEALLAMLERDLHRAPNRVRHAMNGALIAIGMRSLSLEMKALAAAARIGRVEVDHGETGCKTPAAAPYIRKAVDTRGHTLT